MNVALKWIYISLGWLSLLLGLIGAFLPIMPTTPFVILSAFFFSKGSEKMHQWLLENKYFGKMIREWESHGVIRPKAKLMSTFAIVPVFVVSIVVAKVNVYIKIALGMIAIALLTFIYTRPGSKEESQRRRASTANQG